MTIFPNASAGEPGVRNMRRKACTQTGETGALSYSYRAVVIGDRQKRSLLIYRPDGSLSRKRETVTAGVSV